MKNPFSSISLFDPLTKSLIQLAQALFDRQLDAVIAQHAGDHRAVDALKACKGAVDGAVQSLLLAQPDDGQGQVGDTAGAVA